MVVCSLSCMTISISRPYTHLSSVLNKKKIEFKRNGAAIIDSTQYQVSTHLKIFPVYLNWFELVHIFLSQLKIIFSLFRPLNSSNQSMHVFLPHFFLSWMFLSDFQPMTEISIAFIALKWTDPHVLFLIKNFFQFLKFVPIAKCN